MKARVHGVYDFVFSRRRRTRCIRVWGGGDEKGDERIYYYYKRLPCVVHNPFMVIIVLTVLRNRYLRARRYSSI